MNKRIFIIDDEPDMVKIGTDLLESEGFTVTSSQHPVEGLKKLRQNPPDLILLDVRLPEMDGFQVCKEIRNDPRTKHIPIIMISVKSDETDVVVGLEMGADDYISKPFRKLELIARVKSVLRRKDPTPNAQKLQLGNISVDFGRYSATLSNKELELTPKEFELLGYFLRMHGRVMTRASISESVWGIEYTGSSRTIDVHVDQLRRKLGKIGDSIISLKGIGYRFELDS